eukprot:1950836-Rhodomonas_salina.2
MFVYLFGAWILRVFLVLVWGIELRASFAASSAGSPGFYTEYPGTTNLGMNFRPKTVQKRGGERKFTTRSACRDSYPPSKIVPGYPGMASGTCVLLESDFAVCYCRAAQPGKSFNTRESLGRSDHVRERL